MIPAARGEPPPHFFGGNHGNRKSSKQRASPSLHGSAPRISDASAFARGDPPQLGLGSDATVAWWPVMFRDNKVAFAILFILYALCGTADFVYQVEMEAMHQHVGG